ncbi:MAG TPA: hypothetical protein VHV31_04365 [Nitrolancea sp.]|jgi:hypothetical protein|nr:hypothetical protein [Nitrolancea sp.]
MMREELLETHAQPTDGAESAANVASSPIDLSRLGNVSTSYRHHDRLLTSREPLILPGAFLKWYELRRADEIVPDALTSDARSLVANQVSGGQIDVDYGVGFVVLHYSPPLTYLIVGSWRENQEFWETLYTRDLRTESPFERAEPGTNAPTLCVWELAPVWHERQAWTRYLYSNRDTHAKRTYLTDYLSGAV